MELNSLLMYGTLSYFVLFSSALVYTTHSQLVGCSEAECHFGAATGLVQQTINGIPLGPGPLHPATCENSVNKLIMSSDVVGCGSLYTTYRNSLLSACGFIPPYKKHPAPCNEYTISSSANVIGVSMYLGVGIILLIRQFARE